jgi:putative transposase
VRRMVPLSAEIEQRIDGLLATGMAGEDPQWVLSELARLGARSIIRRAVEEEFDAWLGRSRYERRLDAPPGKRYGFRPRRVQTGRVSCGWRSRRSARPPSRSSRGCSRTGPGCCAPSRSRRWSSARLSAGCRCAMSSRCASRRGSGSSPNRTASRICSELRERFLAFERRDLYETQLVALFLDAIYLPVRRQGPKEGVLCAWGFTANGDRALVSVCRGMRESEEDWLALGRGLTRRGLGAQMLIVADGAPGLIKAVEQLWPRSDRQHCTVHRLRNLLAKLPKQDRERVRLAYWHALDEATSQADGTRGYKC